MEGRAEQGALYSLHKGCGRRQGRYAQPDNRNHRLARHQYPLHRPLANEGQPAGRYCECGGALVERGGYGHLRNPEARWRKTSL